MQFAGVFELVEGMQAASRDSLVLLTTNATATETNKQRNQYQKVEDLQFG